MWATSFGIIWGVFFYKYGIALNLDKKSYDIIFNIQYDIIIINLRPLYQYIRSLSGIWILVIDGTAILVRFCGLKYSTRNFAGKTLLWERKDDFMIIFKSTYQNSYVSFTWSYMHSNKSIQRWKPQWLGIFRSKWNMYGTAKSRQSQLKLGLSFMILARINW